MNGPLVFIACPYTIGSEAANVHRAMAVHVELLDAGVPSLCPVLTHFADIAHPRPYESWMDLALAQVAACGHVLRLEGESAGADREVKHAASLGIPVWFEMDGGTVAHFVESLNLPGVPV